MRGGRVSEALIDLTGCPTISYKLNDDNVREFFKNGNLWSLIEYFKSEGYLVVFESDPIKRWATCEDVTEIDKKAKKTSDATQ